MNRTCGCIQARPQYENTGRVRLAMSLAQGIGRLCEFDIAGGSLRDVPDCVDNLLGLFLFNNGYPNRVNERVAQTRPKTMA